MEYIIPLILATLVLVAIPGPNVALIIANSLRFGTRFGLYTVAGTTLGLGIQLLLVVIGIGSMLDYLAEMLSWIKWAGVVYLIYLAIRTWRMPVADLSGIRADSKMARDFFWRGVFIAAVNPKTLIFNAAFLPQFVAPEGNYLIQMALVALVFLTTVTLGDSLWAISASAARGYMLCVQHLTNRIGAVFFMAAGLALAFNEKE